MWEQNLNLIISSIKYGTVVIGIYENAEPGKIVEICDGKLIIKCGKVL